ncbi:MULTISPECIES: hypothetical protein [Robiginitalea]|uniref:hypothetical protein n=1 Tax=Robiginitalea TaxID=252306 RepID=UPI00234A332E|nr:MULTISPECIES: hypothetical protein [unclassified Robiginitalea]MDC6355428.1 hypothetical protein [Robiginitalea sp. PM2]MDC6375962.1 hypothetical protein [Robiginitalea sp. SP8]
MAKEVLPEELMNSVLGKLYDVLTNGDDVVPQSDDNYLAWLPVGMPYPKDELEFLSTGFSGVYREPEPVAVAAGEAGGAPAPRQKTAEEINQLLAQDVTRKYMQAENLARLCDMVPDTSGVRGDVTMNKWEQENSLSLAYQHILKFSQVANFEPDEKTKAKIKRLRGLLQEKKVKKNIVTEEEEEVLEETALVKKYNEKLQNFLNVALEYNNHRVNALAGKDPAAVHFWAMNANILRNKVTAAKNDWITNGFKEEYDQIAAFIAQVEGRSMLTLKQQYIDDMDKARLTGPSSGSDFFYTSLLPGGFAETDNGWTEFTFGQTDFASNYKFNSKKGSGGGGLSLGFFNIGGGGSYEKQKSSRKIDVSTFRLKFKICQVPISRPWFNVNYLSSKYWRFDQNNGEFRDNMVSDGNSPPNGMIPAFTTTAVFVRDLNLHFGERNSEVQTEMENASGGGFVSWGPFHAGGKYETHNQERDMTSHSENQGIRINGMQLIGFKCHVLGKSPDPKPDVSEWV